MKTIRKDGLEDESGKSVQSSGLLSEGYKTVHKARVSKVGRMNIPDNCKKVVI